MNGRAHPDAGSDDDAADGRLVEKNRGALPTIFLLVVRSSAMGWRAGEGAFQLSDGKRPRMTCVGPFMLLKDGSSNTRAV